MNQFDLNDYEAMMALGNKTAQLEQQMQLAGGIRDRAMQAQSPNRASAIMNGLSGLIGQYANTKAGQGVVNNRGQQNQMLLRMMMGAQGGGAPSADPTSYGLMPPKPRNPMALGGNLEDY